MAELGIIATVASAGLSAASALASSRAEQKGLLATASAKESEALQLEQEASQERAAAQREAIQQRQQTEQIMSAARVAAAGAGRDPGGVTETKIVQDIASEGELRRLGSLYRGERRAQAQEFGARIARSEAGQARSTAKDVRRTGFIAAGGQIASAAVGSFASKYGGAAGGDDFASQVSSGEVVSGGAFQGAGGRTFTPIPQPKPF